MSKASSNTGFLNIYVLIGASHIIALALHVDVVVMLTKFLLMPALMLHVYKHARVSTVLRNRLLFVLFFSWVGDILLMFDENNSNFFIFGLTAFLIAQAAYITAFSIAAHKSNGSSLPPGLLLIPPIYAGILLSILIPHLGDMLIPVVIYSMVITAMLMQSLRRWSKTDNYSFWFVAIGATFFIASDSMIAIDSFYSPINFAPLLIMITYIIAQYMLVTGLLIHEDKAINPPQSGQ